MLVRIILLTLIVCLLQSQNVGIGTNVPDASALLELNSNNKGFLMTRVALTGTTDNTTIPIPATGLLVYNTSNVNDVTPGFYYWDGTKWVRLRDTESNDWKLTGNAGTNPTTNFIGTLDPQDLVFKTNNTENMRIANSTGFIGIGTSAPSAKLHVIGGAFFETGNTNALNNYFIIKSNSTNANQGGLLITNSGSYLSGTGTAMKFVTNNTNGSFPQEFKMGWTDLASPNSFEFRKVIHINSDFAITVGWEQYLGGNYRMLIKGNNSGSNNFLTLQDSLPSATDATIAIRLNNEGRNSYRLYLGGQAGYYGVQGDAFEIWEYPNNSGYCCRNRFRIQSSFPLLSWGRSPVTITQNNEVAAYAHITFSDKNLKENIKNFNENVLNKIQNVNIYTYNYKNKTKQEIGLIAQEIEKIFPNLVYNVSIREEQNGEYIDKTIKGIDYGMLTPILIKAIQELNSKIQKLEQENIELKKKLENLNSNKNY